MRACVLFVALLLPLATLSECDVTFEPQNNINVVIQAHITTEPDHKLICLAAGTFTMSSSYGFTFSSGPGMTVRGATNGATIIEGGNDPGRFVRVFNGQSGTIEILTVRNMVGDTTTCSDRGSFACVESGGYLVLKNIIATSACASGGGGFAYATGRLTLLDSDISDCTVSGQNIHGGGVWANGGSSVLVVKRSVFRGLGAYRGGAVAAEDGDVTMSDCTFENNEAQSVGGAVFYDDNMNSCVLTSASFTDNTGGQYGGGAVYVEGWGGSATCELSQLSFDSNQAAQTGGADIGMWGVEVHASASTFTDSYGYRGGAIRLYDNSSLTLSGCTFTGTTAINSGGVIEVEESDLTVSGCTFADAYAGDVGGCIALEGQRMNVLIEDSVFDGCTADYEGGGIIVGYDFNLPARPQVVIRDSVFTHCVSDDCGGGITLWKGDVQLTNTAVYSCTGTDAGGGVCVDPKVSGDVTLAVTDLYVVGNTGTQTEEVYCSSYYTDVQSVCGWESGVGPDYTCEDTGPIEYTFYPFPNMPICGVSPCMGENECSSNKVCTTELFGYSCEKKEKEGGMGGFAGFVGNGNDARVTQGLVATALTLTGVVLLVTAAVCAVNTCVYRESGSADVARAVFAVMSTCAFVLFLWSVSGRVRGTGWAGGVVVVVGVGANAIALVWSVRRELSVPTSAAWVREHASAFAWLSFLSTLNLTVFSVLGSKFLGLSAVGAPWSESMRMRVGWLSCFSTLVCDLPHLCITLAVIIFVDGSAVGVSKSFALLSAAMSAVLVLTSAVKLASLCLVAMLDAAPDGTTTTTTTSNSTFAKSDDVAGGEKGVNGTESVRTASADNTALLHSTSTVPMQSVSSDTAPQTRMTPTTHGSSASVETVRNDNTNVWHANSVAVPVSIPEGVAFCEAPAEKVEYPDVVYYERPYTDSDEPATARSGGGGDVNTALQTQRSEASGWNQPPPPSVSGEIATARV